MRAGLPTEQAEPLPKGSRRSLRYVGPIAAVLQRKPRICRRGSVQSSFAHADIRDHPRRSVRNGSARGQLQRRAPRASRLVTDAARLQAVGPAVDPPPFCVWTGDDRDECCQTNLPRLQHFSSKLSHAARRVSSRMKEFRRTLPEVALARNSHRHREFRSLVTEVIVYRQFKLCSRMPSPDATALPSSDGM